MATMISEVYDAFRSAGVDEGKARQAAEALSREQIATKQDVYEIKAILKLHGWMLGIIITVEVLPLLKVLLPG